MNSQTVDDQIEVSLIQLPSGDNINIIVSSLHVASSISTVDAISFYNTNMTI